MSILFMLLQIFIVILLAPLFDGIARVLRAKMQSRKGPCDIFQSYRDIQKLLKRNRTIPSCAHWAFKIGPYVFFGTGAAMLAVIPISYDAGSLASYASDIFVVIYIGAMLRFIFGVVSIDSGSPFAGIGGSREQMLAVFVEPVMIISLLVVMLLAQTSNLAEINTMVRNGDIGYHMPAYIIASITFLWAMYVECGRNPYDLAEAEQELQEGVLGEYCGVDFSLAHMGLLLKQFAMIAMFLVIFNPWSFSNPFLSLSLFIVQAGVFYVGAVFIDNLGPRHKLLTSFKANAFIALCVSLFALLFYIIGVHNV